MLVPDDHDDTSSGSSSNTAVGTMLVDIPDIGVHQQQQVRSTSTHEVEMTGSHLIRVLMLTR